MNESRAQRFVCRMRRVSPRRVLLAAGGVVCVALGAIGAIVPGLPTTVFLIIATYLFTRSCPWLEERLIRRNALFAPFLGYLDGNARMPLRAKIVTLAIMWTFVTSSVWMLSLRQTVPSWVLLLPPAAALVGSYFIVRFGTSAPIAAAAGSRPMSGGGNG